MLVPLRETLITTEVKAYSEGLMKEAAELRMPELFTPIHAGSIYSVDNRNGISVIVVRSSALTEKQITQILQWRLAQYIAVQFVDLVRVYETQMRYEPRENVLPDDVHIIAGSVESGEIVGYATIKAPLPVSANVTMRETDRPLLNTEKVFGWGILNRLRIVPDLPVVKVRELERYVKNQQLPPHSELNLRAPVEVGVAILRTITGPLRMEIDLIMNEIEEGVAGRNLAFFHMPLVTIRNVAPSADHDAYLLWRFQYQPVRAYAVLVSDTAAILDTRLAAIEAALERPGAEGIAALGALRGEQPQLQSRLLPDPKLMPLIDTQPAHDTSMAARQQLFAQGMRLREMPLFQGLTVAEAALIGSVMELVTVEEGTVIMRSGEEGGSLYIIESGQASVYISGQDGGDLELEQLGPGDYFGEVSLLTKSKPIADIAARTPMRLFRLRPEIYQQYLEPLVEIREQLAMTAARRMAAILGKSGMRE